MLVDPSGESATLEVWDADSRRRVAGLDVPDVPTAVRFSPDGRLLAVGYPHGRSRLWSTTNWKPATRLLAGDVGTIYAVAISRDGRTLATGSEDRTVRLWDIESQQAIGAPLPGPGRGVGAVAPYFTPDGAALIASYDTGRASAGTSVPSHSHATPAGSPADASRRPNGPSSYPAATTTRPAERRS